MEMNNDRINEVRARYENCRAIGASNLTISAITNLLRDCGDMLAEIDRLTEAQRTACDKCPGLGLMISRGYGTVVPLPTTPDAVDKLQASRCAKADCEGCQFEVGDDCGLYGLTREEANAAIAAPERGE